MTERGFPISSRGFELASLHGRDDRRLRTPMRRDAQGDRSGLSWVITIAGGLTFLVGMAVAGALAGHDEDAGTIPPLSSDPVTVAAIVAAATREAAASVAGPSGSAPTTLPLAPLEPASPPTTESEPDAAPALPIEPGGRTATPSPDPTERPDPAASTLDPSRTSPLRPAWQRNAVAPPAVDGRPWVVVVIDDMGIDPVRSARIAALGAPLTLSWLPYATDVRQQAARARAQGHETLLHLPMEPVGTGDPGPRALRIDDQPKARLASLDWALGRIDGVVGVNNHMGSRFTADEAALRPILAAIARRGLLFLDSRTTALSRAEAVALDLGMPVAARQVFLDAQPTRALIDQQLAALERAAHRTGAAIAIGHPHDDTIAALAAWLPQIEARGLRLAPLSAVVGRGLGRTAPMVSVAQSGAVR